MRAILVLAVCGCNLGAPPPAQVEPPAARVEAPATATGIVSRSIAVDGGRGCAIEATGKVACWGQRSATQLDPTPVEVTALDDVVGVEAGPGAMCAWTAHGAVACWGDDPSHRFAPALDDIIQVSLGESSACALHATGRVSCWENGGRDVEDIAGLADAVEIAGAYGGGAEQLCARTKSGDVTCGNSVSPFEVIPELAGATSLSGAGCRFAVLMPGHRLAGWVGFTGRPMPTYIDGVDGERVIVGGHLNGVAAICVLGTHARCWSWSNEPVTLSQAPPVRDGVRDLALDTEETCERVGDRVECSGRLGRLGDGETEYPPTFVPASGITDARQIEAIGRTTCALRATGRVACWGERLRGDGADAIDHEPVELPGVTDAVEIAMEGTDRGDGTIGGAASVCARRVHGATCWTTEDGELVASDAPELASAVKLYSGPAVCGAATSGAVRCVPLHHTEGYIPSFAEDDYEKYIYRGSSTTAALRVTRELERRLRRALASNRQLAGFHASTTSDTVDRTDLSFQPPVDPLTDVIQLRRLAWATDWESGRARGVVCARRASGSVACWGERDYLGAGQHSTRADPVPVANLTMGPPRHVPPGHVALQPRTACELGAD
jgi:hypothetical protein